MSDMKMLLHDVSPTLTVGDIARSIAWYRDVLGFELAEQWEEDGTVFGASLTAGGVTLMIGQDDWAKGRDRAKGEGFRLYCTTEQDIDELAAAIRSRGGELAQEPTDQPWGVRDFAVIDPDGFKISIAAARGDSSGS